MKKQELYISVDIEADGPIPGDYSMSSIGAVVAADFTKTFYREMMPISEKWDPAAAAVSGLNRELLKTQGTHPANAMREMDAWVKTVCGETHRPVFVSFNATFDWMFSHWYFIHFHGSDPFGISGLEMKSFYAGLIGCDWGETTKKYVAKRFPSKQAHTHNALDDAKEQAEIFNGMWKASKERFKNAAHL